MLIKCLRITTLSLRFRTNHPFFCSINERLIVSKITQQEMNHRVGLTIVGTIGFLAKRICGWQGVLIYGYGIVVGGVATLFMQENNKPTKIISVSDDIIN